ncbi:MAG: PfkB family carbohydrate kinase [Alphaproteobacteria bacterium]|jgi:rfaE bifunctional protein nucleotidyltransferase chain/domain|nr:PfkB family carbohydrate kinase [Alphaproteobacteria bacterium]
MNANDMSDEVGAVPPGEAGSARDRIKTVAELAEISRHARDQGQTVVLAHGVFDLLHLGHVRHLEAARRLGDVLIVTVTADSFVKKGPGRPVFPQTIRAEMLAALGYVDWTGINNAPTAESLIEAIEPDIYVKGKEYANVEDDVTGMIGIEREIAEKHGGRLVFTDEVTFSSSGLINEYFDIHDPEARAFLDDLRHNDGSDRVLGLLDRLAGLKVLMIGETIIDEYDYVDTIGKPSKESIIAALYRDREVFAGGVIAAANHLAGFCDDVEVVTYLGGPESQEFLVNEHLHPNIALKPYFQDKRPTVRKRRFVEESTLRKLFEVYYMDDSLLDDALGADIADYVAARCGDFDVVIVCDFGHGLMVKPVIEAVEDNARFLAINVQANAGNMGYSVVTKYRRADYLCVGEGEARLAVHDKNEDMESIISKRLPESVRCGRIAVTLSGRGSLCWSRDDGVTHVPAFAHTPVDTIGAGDAFLAVTAPLYAIGGGAKEVGFIGNVVGGIKTGVVGHRQAVDKGAVKNAIVSLLK